MRVSVSGYWGYHRQGSCQAGLGAAMSKVSRKKKYWTHNISLVENISLKRHQRFTRNVDSIHVSWMHRWKFNCNEFSYLFKYIWVSRIGKPSTRSTTPCHRVAASPRKPRDPTRRLLLLLVRQKEASVCNSKNIPPRISHNGFTNHRAPSQSQARYRSERVEHDWRGIKIQSLKLLKSTSEPKYESFPWRALSLYDL